MAIAPRCYLTGASATLASFSPALTGWTNAGAGPTGTAPVAGDLVLMFSSLGQTGRTFSQTAGTTWGDGSAGPDTNGGSVPLSSVVKARIWDGTETAPTFAWSASSRGTWVVVAIAPDAGSTISLDVLGTVTKDTTAATTHTASAATATGTDLSLLYMALEAAAIGTTAISVTTQPTGWTALVNVSQIGSGSVQSNAGNLAYNTGQTGTVTPGAATINVSTEANIYHLLITETAAAVAAIPEVVMAPPVVH